MSLVQYTVLFYLNIICLLCLLFFYFVFIVSISNVTYYSTTLYNMCDLWTLLIEGNYFICVYYDWMNDRLSLFTHKYVNAQRRSYLEAYNDSLIEQQFN